MEYKKGFKIKPDTIKIDGSVLFTDGTNDVLPNQLACEAYGYRYDTITGVCMAYNYTSKVADYNKAAVENNTKKGTNNTTELGTQNTFINGRDNTTKGHNENCFITGKNHTIDNNISNASVLGGNNSNVSHEGEVSIGGGELTTEEGFRQYSIYQVSGETTGSDIQLKLQGKTQEITVPSNSICIFEVYVTGVCTGGSSGTVGDYKTKRIMGSLHIENSGGITKTETLSTDLGNSGTTGTVTLVVSTANTFIINISGAINVATTWSGTVKLYINKTQTEI